MNKGTAEAPKWVPIAFPGDRAVEQTINQYGRERVSFIDPNKEDTAGAPRQYWFRKSAKDEWTPATAEGKVALTTAIQDHGFSNVLLNDPFAGAGERLPRADQVFAPEQPRGQAAKELVAEYGKSLSDEMQKLMLAGDFNAVAQMGGLPPKALEKWETKTLDIAKERLDSKFYRDETSANAAQTWFNKQVKERTDQSISSIPGQLEAAMQTSPDPFASVREQALATPHVNQKEVTAALDKLEGRVTEAARAKEEAEAKDFETRKSALPDDKQRMIEKASPKQKREVLEQMERQKSKVEKEVKQVLENAKGKGPTVQANAWENVQAKMKKSGLFRDDEILSYFRLAVAPPSDERRVVAQ